MEITNASRVLYCAGQAAVDDNGKPVHAGDMRKQLEQAFRNLETVLQASGFGLANVVRLNYYTTDVDAFLGAADVVGARLSAAACQPSGTLLGVSKLAFPGLLIEIEATAVR
jgi:enamine deaminase RidA (YjgF/YER057c/UK114 family)